MVIFRRSEGIELKSIAIVISGYAGLKWISNTQHKYSRLGSLYSRPRIFVNAQWRFCCAPDESSAKFEARLAKRMQCRRAKQDYDLYNLPCGKWTLYDLRRTVATRMEELGVERDMIARVPAHTRPDAKTTGRYARHIHWEQRCKTLDLL